MIVLLVFFLAAQDSTAIAMPGNAQMETGLALGRLLEGSLDFVIIGFTPVTQLVNLSPDPAYRIRWDHKDIPSAGSDVSKHDLTHTAGSQLRRMIALECSGDAAQKLPADGNEFQAQANLECSCLDAFMVVSGLSQGAHLMSAKISDLQALKVSMVGIQAQHSTQSRQLKSSGSVLDKTAVLVTLPADLLSHHHPHGLMIDTQQPDWLRYEAAAKLWFAVCVLDEAQIPSYFIVQKAPKRIQQQGGMGLGSVQLEVTQRVGSAFIIHVSVQKEETELLPFLPYAATQDTYSQKSFSSVDYRLSDGSTTLDMFPLLAYQESDAPQYHLPEICTPQTIIRVNHLYFHAVKKEGSKARIQIAHSQWVVCTQKTNSASLSLLSNYSLVSRVNLAVVPPPRMFLCVQKPVWYLLHPEDSWVQAKWLYQFHGHKPIVKQLLYSILKNQKDGVNSLILDYSEALITRYGLLHHLSQLFCAVFSFFLVIVFAWGMDKSFEMLGNWLEHHPFENEELVRFRQNGEAIIRHFCHNVFRNY